MLAGPGLPDPDVLLPFELPDGYGAIVMPNVAPGEVRETFYEPFGGKSYYSGPVLDIELEIPGVYYVYYWDPYQIGGDYVGVLGGEEIWNPKDIASGLYYTPLHSGQQGTARGVCGALTYGCRRKIYHELLNWRSA